MHEAVYRSPFSIPAAALAIPCRVDADRLRADIRTASENVTRRAATTKKTNPTNAFVAHFMVTIWAREEPTGVHSQLAF